MSLTVGVLVLVAAVILGGAAALLREPPRAFVAALRTFAVAAVAGIALLHLLPEAVGAVGVGALAAALVGALGPSLLERSHHLAARSRLGGHGHAHPHDAPTTTLAMGYAAVIAHQAGEGAALASLATTGGLSLGIVLAIAAHTVPLAMVVALRALDARSGGDASSWRGVALALAGVAGATALGAIAGTLVGGDRLRAVQPWLLALVAGLLLHALAHDAPSAPSTQPPALSAIGAAVASAIGLALACFDPEPGSLLEHVPASLRALGVIAVAVGVAARGARAPKTSS